jgi:imidazolonepropionase-like amidohydrolase
MQHSLARWLGRILVGFSLAGAVVSAHAQERPLALLGARLIPIHGDPIEHGVLLVQGGKIKAIGASNEVVIPPEAERRDLTGKTLMPGLVDTHSHIGLATSGSNERSGPLNPEMRALDAVDIRDPALQRARAGGITTVNIMPGSGNLIGGQTIYLKLRQGRTIDDLLLRTPTGRIAGGLKMANGTNPQGDPPYSGTRAKAAALVREKFVAAQVYREKMAKAGSDPDKAPTRDIALESLVEVLTGDRLVHHHTHRHDDIMTVLRLQKEFGFRLVLHHVSEGYKVAQEIAAAKVPCSVIVVDSPGGKLEARDMDWKTAGVLERAGVLVGFHTDDPVTDSRLFLRSAAVAVRSGMTREGALRAVTSAGAKMLDLDDRVGVLEVGKDADFLVLTGDPLSVYTHVEETWIEGVRVFDRSDPKDALLATGGRGAGNPRAASLCCFGNGGDQ